MNRKSLGYWAACALALWLWTHASAQAAQIFVREQLPSGMGVSAEYRQGRTGMPAVVLIHGFLATHYYPTLEILKDTFDAMGYTVVAPMLSLGVPDRKTSRSCEAMHTHTMVDAVSEIGFWLRWAKRKTGMPSILAGHSFGAVMALAYLLDTPPERQEVSRYIGVSLVATEYYLARGTTSVERRRVLKTLQNDDPNAEGVYPLSLCKRYVTTPRAFLSYAEWDYDKIRMAAKRIGGHMRAYAIVGGGDDRTPPGWDKSLREAGFEVRVVAGANHFFGGEHEFSLMEEIERLRSKP